MNLKDTLWHRILRRPYRLQLTSDTGKGKPLVLLHGIASSGHVWQPLIKQLDPAKWRVIAPDLLGFGESPKPDWSSYDVKQHARSVVVTLRKLGIKKGVTLAGHSMGSLVAVHIAAKYPKLVKRLVLYEPPLFADLSDYKVHTRRRDRHFAFYDYLVARPQLVLGYVRALGRLAKRFGVFMTPDSWIPFERSLRHTIMRQTAYDELHAIALRTDIIHGRLDFVVTRAEVKRMFADNPHIHMHIVNQLHGVTPRAAKYLAGLLSG